MKLWDDIVEFWTADKRAPAIDHSAQSLAHTLAGLFSPEDLRRINEAAQAAKRPRAEWLRDVVLEAVEFSEQHRA